MHPLKRAQTFTFLPATLYRVFSQKNATGVEFSASANATRQQTKAKREVILAAGTLHTPQLLQVSGIGEASLLESINVETVVDLPAVGYNLHDHLSIAVVNIREYNVICSSWRNH